MVLLPGCECCGSCECLPLCRYKLSISTTYGGSSSSLSSPSVCDTSSNSVSVQKSPGVLQSLFIGSCSYNQNNPADVISVSCPGLDARLSGLRGYSCESSGNRAFATGFEIGAKFFCESVGGAGFRMGVDLYFSMNSTLIIENPNDGLRLNLCAYSNASRTKRVYLADACQFELANPIQWSIASKAASTSFGAWDSTSLFVSGTANFNGCRGTQSGGPDITEEIDLMPQVSFTLETREACETNPLP
jgi:hypothetical protein